MSCCAVLPVVRAGGSTRSSEGASQQAACSSCVLGVGVRQVEPGRRRCEGWLSSAGATTNFSWLQWRLCLPQGDEEVPYNPTVVILTACSYKLFAHQLEV